VAPGARRRAAWDTGRGVRGRGARGAGARGAGARGAEARGGHREADAWLAGRRLAGRHPAGRCPLGGRLVGSRPARYLAPARPATLHTRRRDRGGREHPGEPKGFGRPEAKREEEYERPTGEGENTGFGRAEASGASAARGAERRLIYTPVGYPSVIVGQNWRNAPRLTHNHARPRFQAQFRTRTGEMSAPPLAPDCTRPAFDPQSCLIPPVSSAKRGRRGG